MSVIYNYTTTFIVALICSPLFGRGVRGEVIKQEKSVNKFQDDTGYN